MRSTDENRFLFSAWGISIGVHGVAVGLALAFATQVKPVLKENIFKWDVALVQAIDSEPTIERAEPLVKPAQPTARMTPTPPAEPTSDMVMSRVAPQQSVQMVHPVIEPAKPIEQKVEPPPQTETEPVEQRSATPQPKIEPIEPKVVEVAKPKIKPVAPAVVEAKEPEPAEHAEPVMAQRQVVTPAAIADESTSTQQTYHQPASHASVAVPSHETPVADAAPARSSQHEERHQASAHPDVDAPPVADVAQTTMPSHDKTAAVEVPVQVAKAAATGSEVKADHRWLAESLWRRVAELKRYPSSARLNGQEGKVILKAVIRSDGQLTEVSVQKSSGHAVLDAAAIEAVKLACPLHMKHAIGKPEIVVSLPIVYSLAN